jgi:hypothetical protein
MDVFGIVLLVVMAVVACSSVLDDLPLEASKANS